MNKIIKLSLSGIAIGCTIFTFIGIIINFFNNGSFELLQWSFTKMAIGSMIVGMGFSIPSLIYESRKISLLVKILIHMGIGCAIMLITSFTVGWIPLSLGLFIPASIILSMFITAFIIWLCFFTYYKKQAQKMNKKIKEKQA